MRRVLVIDDDRANIDQLVKILSNDGYNLQTAADVQNAIHRIKAWKPHLLLLNLSLLGAERADLISQLRKAAQEDYLSIVLLADQSDLDGALAGLDCGADDFLIKPFRPQELVTRVKTLLRFKEAQDSLYRANQKIEELSSTDELTGLMNMRTLHRYGEEEILRSRRFRKPVSALLINLDRFSEINHEYGFTVGSGILQEAANRIRRCLRSIDRASRIGADEFFVFLTETDLANAEFMAERIRDAIQAEPYTGSHKDAKISVKLTACVGVAGFGGDQPNAQMGDLLRSATEALQSAKAAGPNSIEIYSFA